MTRKLENIERGEYPFKSEIESMNMMKKGLNKITLTNMDNRLEPMIKAGSILEVNNVIYSFDSDEPIEGDLTDVVGKVWIKTKREIINDEEVLTVEYDYENTPTWNNKKKGYYLGLDRYFSSFYYKDNIYQNKIIIYEEDIDYSGLEYCSITYDNQFVSVQDIVYSDEYKAFYISGFSNGKVLVLKTIDGKTYDLMFEYVYEVATYVRHNVYLKTSNGGFYLAEYKYIGSTKSYYHYFSIDEDSYSIANFATTLQYAGNYLFDGTYHYIDPYGGSSYILMKYDGSTYDTLSISSNTYGMAKIGDRVIIGGLTFCKYTDDFSTLNSTSIDGLKTRIIQTKNKVYAIQPDDTYESGSGDTFYKRCTGTYVGGATDFCILNNEICATTSLGLYKEDYVSPLEDNYFETLIVRENSSAVTGFRDLFSNNESMMLVQTDEEIAYLYKDGEWSIPHDKTLGLEKAAVGLDMIMMKVDDRDDIAIYRI